jgi:flagellar biosynthetic protein FliQ
MYEDWVAGIAVEAIFTVLIVAAPILLIALGVGLFIAILQATTQIQEMTLVFIPKIVAVFIALVFFLPWILSVLVSFTQTLYLAIPAMISI